VVAVAVAVALVNVAEADALNGGWEFCSRDRTL